MIKEKILRGIEFILKIIFLVIITGVISILSVAIVKFLFYFLADIPYDGFNIENPFDVMLAIVFANIFANRCTIFRDSKEHLDG